MTWECTAKFHVCPPDAKFRRWEGGIVLTLPSPLPELPPTVQFNTTAGTFAELSTKLAAQMDRYLRAYSGKGGGTS